MTLVQAHTSIPSPIHVHVHTHAQHAYHVLSLDVSVVYIGEGVYSSLHGSSVDVNVRLDRSSIQLESTYIGLSTQR